MRDGRWKQDDQRQLAIAGLISSAMVLVILRALGVADPALDFAGACMAGMRLVHIFHRQGCSQADGKIARVDCLLAVQGCAPPTRM